MMSYDYRFVKMLEFVLARDGGYVNNPYDKGGETNKGITYTIYEQYRKSKNLPVQSVKDISNDEVYEIYYKNYYKASGADMIDDPKLSIYVFDTAVNMGISVAKDLLKKSNGDINKYETLRKEKYQKYVNYDASQGRFLAGWNNRVNQLKEYADNTFIDNTIKYNLGINMDVDENGNIIHYYNNDDLRLLNIYKLKKFLPQIIDKLFKKQHSKDSHNNKECVGSYPVNGYTRSDGTKVNSYTRTCGAKHLRMSEAERKAGQEKYKNKRFQDIPVEEYSEAISYFI